MMARDAVQSLQDGSEPSAAAGIGAGKSSRADRQQRRPDSHRQPRASRLCTQHDAYAGMLCHSGKRPENGCVKDDSRLFGRTTILTVTVVLESFVIGTTRPSVFIAYSNGKYLHESIAAVVGWYCCRWTNHGNDSSPDNLPRRHAPQRDVDDRASAQYLRFGSGAARAACSRLTRPIR